MSQHHPSARSAEHRQPRSMKNASTARTNFTRSVYETPAVPQWFIDAAGAVVILEDLLALLHIEQWDYLLVGDGSGSRWPYPMGWTSVLIDRESGGREVFHGGMSSGTNSIAEIMAYIQPLIYLTSSRKSLAPKQIHVVTDCNYLVLAAADKRQRKSHHELWAFIESCGQRGLRTAWHYIPRDTVDLNKFSHSLANLARENAESVKKHGIGDVIDAMAVGSIHELCPTAAMLVEIRTKQQAAEAAAE